MWFNLFITFHYMNNVSIFINAIFEIRFFFNNCFIWNKSSILFISFSITLVINKYAAKFNFVTKQSFCFFWRFCSYSITTSCITK